MDAWNALIGLGGVIVGAALTIFGNAIHHWHVQRVDLFKRVLAFYWSRIEALIAVEGTLVVSLDEPELEKARAPLNAELLLVAPQNVLEAEQKMYEFMHDREFQKAMAMRQWREERTQGTRRIGKGSNENSAIDLETLKHAQALFDESYEGLVNILRQEMTFCKTIRMKITRLKLPSRFGIFRPFNLVSERMYKDPASVEAIFRGRIADRMAAQGASPFDVHSMTEMIPSTTGSSMNYAVEVSPPTPKQTDDKEKIVFGSLGYDFLWFYDRKRAEECKQGIAQYFSRLSAGRITLKKRSTDNPRCWADVLTVTSETKLQLFEFIDKELKKYQEELLQTQRMEEERWEVILREANKPIPKLPKQTMESGHDSGQVPVKINEKNHVTPGSNLDMSQL